MQKLTAYCLSPTHPTGKYKAEQFQKRMGIMQSDAEWFKEQIMIALATNEAIENIEDQFGKRYVVNMELTHIANESLIRVTTVWIIKTEENFPRMITCYINEK